MSDRFHCDDKATLMAFLYGEIDPSQRQGVEDHLHHCEACARELDALSTVRAELATWAPPDVALGFGVAPAARPARWWAEVPAWAQAAAAVLVLAAGAGLASLQIRSGPDGVVVSTGWRTPAKAAVPLAPAPPDQSWKAELAAIEARLRGELTAGRTQVSTPAPPARAGNVDAEAVLQQVRALLEDSERRQRQELALRLTQFNRDMDIQRRADLVRIEQGLGQVEGRTGAEMARQRQMLNYVMRVSGQPPQ